MSAGAVRVAGTTAGASFAAFVAFVAAAGGLVLPADFDALGDFASAAGGWAGWPGWPATGHAFEGARLTTARAEFTFASMFGSTSATEKGQSPSCWAI